MSANTAFYVISGVWGLAMIINFIGAIRLCYRIEDRSGIGGRKKTGLPAYANIFGVAFNHGVADDAETQALRRQMNIRLLTVLSGLVLFALWASLGDMRA